MGNDTKKPDHSQRSTNIMVAVWLAVYIVGILACFLVDTFVRYPIAPLSSYDGKTMTEEDMLELVQTVYPDAEILESETSVSIKTFWVQTREETHVMTFRCHPLTPIFRWKLLGDVTVPEGYTGSLSVDSTLSSVSVDFVDGVLIMPNHSLSVDWMSSTTVLSLYGIIPMVPATIALLPTWLILKARKKKAA